jgi:hypothetical protein
MKMILAATTYAQRARLDLHSMQLASGLPGPKKRTTPLPKPRKEAQASPTLPGSRRARKSGKSGIYALRRAGCYYDYGDNQR